LSYLQKCHCYISSSARRSTRRRSRRRSSTSVSTRRADEPRPSCSPTRLYPHGVVLVFALPFPSSHSHQAELELSATVSVHAGHPRRRASIRCAPSRTTSPFASSTRSRARSSQPRAESTFRAPVTAGRHCLATPELRPFVDLRPPDYLRPIQAVVSSAVTSSISPTPSPAESRAPAAAAPPRRRVRAAPTARTPWGYSTPALAPPPCAPPPLGLPDARPASLFRRLALPRPERRRRRRAVAPAACAAAARAPLHPTRARPAIRAPWPRFRRAMPPASRRRREPGPPRAACPWPCTGRPAARAGKTEEGGSRPGLPCMWGPAVSRPPPFYCFPFSYFS